MKLSRVREHRTRRRWSQEELARRAKLSRPAVSAIEIGRIVPSVSAALALARVFGCTVEDLFSFEPSQHEANVEWAWPASTDSSPFWEANVGKRVLRIPFESTLNGFLAPDGYADDPHRRRREGPIADPDSTLVIAACDPAVSLLTGELMRMADVRGLPLTRSSRAALELLGKGVVHVAGLHLQDARDPNGNERVVRELLGNGYSLLRISRWREGLVLRPDLRVRSVREATRGNLRWVGRESGSGARRCLDTLLSRRQQSRVYEHLAHDHAGVVQSIRSGWADAGVCVELSAVGAGLSFLPIQEEDYDLCYRTDDEGDPRIQALLTVVRSQRFRMLLGELPGYDNAHTGELQRITS